MNNSDHIHHQKLQRSQLELGKCPECGVVHTRPLHGTIKNDGLSSYAIRNFGVSTGVREDGSGFLAVDLDGQEHVMQLSAEARKHLALLLWPEGEAWLTDEVAA